MTGSVLFLPLLPWPLIAFLSLIATAGVVLARWRGLSGWALRALAAIGLIAALSGPKLQQENRVALNDIVVLLKDKSASQHLSDRAAQTEAAAKTLVAQLSARGNIDLREIDVGDDTGNGGTRLLTGLRDALAKEPQDRIAGIIVLSDGRVHDLEQAPKDLPAPLHLLLSGHDTDWDRRLSIKNAPAFAILGEPVTLTLRIEDSGAAPVTSDGTMLEISVDGGAARRFKAPIGRDIELPVSLPHAGRNVIKFTAPAVPGELTDRNNTVLIQINGVRDRLRVLLVSGEPHPGGRTWRNLLKSDSSVDLVHFTILRPPKKQDGVPVSELSLIAFPTRELFTEKIDDFDLIIFDRYKRRGILPSIYLENVANYVTEGGAVLIAAGPDFASADSLYRSPLARILPAEPTARVIDAGFLPSISEVGQRHPVTAGLPQQGKWGRWLRQIEVAPIAGDTVMQGHDGRPLLVLNRVEKGRVALLASDQAWLWARGYEGGGPQLELLRRLAHWMMGEPELEEEALGAEATGQRMRIIRRTLADNAGPVEITTPSGNIISLPLEEVGPGQFEAVFDGLEMGLFRLVDGDKNAVIGLGPSAPKEFEETIASGDLLADLIHSQRGGIAALEHGLPKLRNTRPGRPAAGRGWIGLTPRGAYETTDVTRVSLLPAWAVLLLISGLILVGWLREGRR